MPKSGQVSADHWKKEYSWSSNLLQDTAPKSVKALLHPLKCCKIYPQEGFQADGSSFLASRNLSLPWSCGVSIAAPSPATGLLLTTSSSNFVLAGFLQGSRLQEADLFSQNTSLFKKKKKIVKGPLSSNKYSSAVFLCMENSVTGSSIKARVQMLKYCLKNSASAVSQSWVHTRPHSNTHTQLRLQQLHRSK